MLLRKISAAFIGTSLLVLLVMGPKLGKVPNKIDIANTSNKTPQIASTNNTDGTTTNPSTGTTSTYNVTPIKLPDGSEIKVPSYTPTSPTSSSSKSNGVTTNSVDPNVCANAQSAINRIQNAYASQDQPLQAEITNYQNYIINNGKTYAARGYGPSADEQASDQRVLLAFQTDQNKLAANMKQMNDQLAPYQQQITANACSS